MASIILVLIYVCFIALGLPDSLLGSAWPVMHTEICVPFSFAGIISTTMFIGTIISSLFSDKLLHVFGTGKLTSISTLLTAIGLFGFSVSNSFWMLIIWAIPYGLGAGAVDALLNNYVALHYKAQHMSWLHCMWGVGASVSPYIMSFSLVNFEGWNYGYLIVTVVQAVISVIVFLSIPLWKNGVDSNETNTASKALSFGEIFATKGAVACFVTFFCYCSLELTTSLWASSYLVQIWSFSPEQAAGFASMFYIGITLGRFANGFLAIKLGDHFLIRTGFAIISLGIILLFTAFNPLGALIGFVVIGLGCAPIYPCIIHMTPNVFGADKSQAMIGIQMAFAYTGFLITPPLFGIIAEYISISLLPIFQIVLLIMMFATHEIVAKRGNNENI